MLSTKFDNKANELLVEFLPAAAPIVVSAGGLGSFATGLVSGIIALLGTAGIIAQNYNKGSKTAETAPVSPSTVDLGGGVTIGKPTEIQPAPPEQQPMTLPNIEQPGYAVPSQIPALRPTHPELRPGIEPETNTKTQVGIAPPIPSTQETGAAAGAPEPPRVGTAVPEQQKGKQPPVVVPPPVGSFRYPYSKRASVEAYPVDQQLGNINVPGTKTAYRDTFNTPTMQAFDVGLNQPPVKQMTPQGDIPNASPALRAKYKHRAENPDEYEGTKAFGGIANLFK